MAVAGGALIAALFIARPAVSRWARGQKKAAEPAAAMVVAVSDQPEAPEPAEPPRAEIVPSMAALDAADIPEPRYPRYSQSTDMPDAVEQSAEQSVEQVAAPYQEAPAYDAPAEDPPPQQMVISLSAGDPAVDVATLSPGQTVRGDPDRRPVIEVPAGGLVVNADNVAFENIDFIAAESVAGEAMITLRGSHAAFDGCSFAAADGTAAENLPVAIAWFCQTAEAQADPPILFLRNSSFEQVAAAVSYRVANVARCQIENVLHLGPGALVSIDRPPERDEQFGLTLSHVTLRAAKAVISVGCQQLPNTLGSLDVEAADCAFALPSAAALVVYDSAVRPGPLLAGLHWTGQGSVLSGRARMAMWHMPEGRLLATRDDAAPIAGVVRGEISFAGSADEGWAGSQIARCEAPFAAARRPGIQ